MRRYMHGGPYGFEVQTSDIDDKLIQVTFGSSWNEAVNRAMLWVDKIACDSSRSDEEKIALLHNLMITSNETGEILQSPALKAYADRQIENIYYNK